MKSFLLLSLFSLVICIYGQVEQVHISLGATKSEMVVMWMTKSSAESCVRFKSSSASTWTYTCGSQKQYNEFGYQSPFIHTATLTGLSPATTYNYACGEKTSDKWSAQFSFVTEANNNDPFSFFAIGDHGTSSDSKQLTTSMVQELKSNPLKPSFIIHAGDLSYANGDQPKWDIYQRDNQRLAAYVPWMYAPGNHEKEKPSNFLAYQKRYKMPYNESVTSNGNLYWSFNYKSAHIIAFDSEIPEDDYSPNSPQFKWLLNDLKTIDRKVTPWVFAFWHTPLYCSNKVHHNEGDKIRKNLEDILYNNGVDIVFNGHVHAYERTFKVYKEKLDKKGVVYITNGAGGTQEGFARPWLSKPSWSASRQASSWGFGLVTIYNSTVLKYEFKENKANKVLDTFFLKKN